MSKKAPVSTAMVSLLLFVALIAGVKVYDVAAIGPEGTEVGFSTLNSAMHSFFGLNMFWYKLTEILGYFAIAIAGVMALFGLLQLIKRRSFAGVDREFYALAGLYVVMGIFYVAFEKVIVNYRPEILPDEVHPEASFPSSHTMLVCVVFGSAIIMCRRYMTHDTSLLFITIALDKFFFITVFGRLISGVHWLTDIIGGVLLSIFLLSAFGMALNMIAEE